MNILDLLGTIAGLFYIYYQFVVSWKLWVASLVMSSFYVILNYQAHLYALTGIYVYYCFAAIWGLWIWKTAKTTEKEETAISHIPTRLYPVLIAAIAILTLALAGVLSLLNEDKMLWGDAFTSATSIVTMWLLARKYVEQWIFWIAVDGVNCLLYASLGRDYQFSSFLFGLYAVVAVFGYFHWRKMMKESELPRKQE